MSAVKKKADPICPPEPSLRNLERKTFAHVMKCADITCSAVGQAWHSNETGFLKRFEPFEQTTFPPLHIVYTFQKGLLGVGRNVFLNNS